MKQKAQAAAADDFCVIDDLRGRRQTSQAGAKTAYNGLAHDRRERASGWKWNTQQPAGGGSLTEEWPVAILSNSVEGQRTARARSRAHDSSMSSGSGIRFVRAVGQIGCCSESSDKWQRKLAWRETEVRALEMHNARKGSRLFHRSARAITATDPNLLAAC